MTGPSKFMFDLDFAAPKVANTIPLADHQTQLTEAETRGYAKGFTAGQQDAEAQTARRLAQTLEKISQTLASIVGGLKKIESRLEAEAVEVAAAVASGGASGIFSPQWRRYAEWISAPGRAAASGFQNAAMLSTLSCSAGISSSVTAPPPNPESGSTQRLGRRSYQAPSS